MKKKIKFKDKLKNLLLTSLLPLTVMGCALLVVFDMGIENYDVITVTLVFLVAIYGALFLQVALHELGHLVFGLFSGYKFSSYRIGSLMLLKENGKLKLKHFSLLGTGGQCLMIPPEMKNGEFPVLLYNFGGPLMNLIVSFLFLILYFRLRDVPFFSPFFLIMAVIGFYLAFVNGVPLRTGMVDNDGRNALMIKKNKKAMADFHLQLKISGKSAGGIRLKDMPEEWFAFPDEESLKNTMGATVAVFCCQRLIDELKLKEGKEKIEELLNGEANLIGIHRFMLKAELIFCNLILNEDTEKIPELYTKDFQKLVKATRKGPNTLRLQYAYTLLYLKNEKEAEKIKKSFYKVLKSYPYKSDIESEKELFELIK